MVISKIQEFERVNKQTYFLYGFKIKTSDMHEYMMNNQEHVKNT